VVSKKEDLKWMKQALALGEKALEAGEFPVGCILVSGNSVVGSGARQHSKLGQLNELDHGEIVAIRDWLSRGAAREGVVSAYCTMEPCLMCLGALILNGVNRIVYAYEDVMGGAAGLDRSEPLTAEWKKSNSAMDKSILQEHLYCADTIEIVGGVCRRESLALFKKFFQDERNSYWKGSLLARYTLNAT